MKETINPIDQGLNHYYMMEELMISGFIAFYYCGSRSSMMLAGDMQLFSSSYSWLQHHANSMTEESACESFYHLVNVHVHDLATLGMCPAAR